MNKHELNEKFFWLFVKKHEFIDYEFARHNFVPGGLTLWAHNRLGDSDEDFVVSTVVSDCGIYSTLEFFQNEYWDWERHASGSNIPSSRASASNI